MGPANLSSNFSRREAAGKQTVSPLPSGGSDTMTDSGSSSARESLLTSALVAYGYVFLWVFLSGAVILYNKWLLAYGGFPFPIALTMFHMAFCGIVAALIVNMGFVSKVEGMTTELYPRVIGPIGALYALVLWTGNSAYLYISVSFIQMLKALAPVSVFVMGCMFGADTFTWPKMANMAVVATGIFIASAGEVEFVTTGVIFQLSSMVMESARLILVQILLQRRGLKLNPVTTLYYVAPCCFSFLLPLFLFLEMPKMKARDDWTFDWFYMLTNASVAFALNIAIFLLIGKTSALTMNVAGVVKDWMLILLSVVLYGSPVMPSQYLGYFIAFLAVAYYNYTKYQAALKDKETSSSRKEDDSKSAASDPERQKLRTSSGGTDDDRV